MKKRETKNKDKEQKRLRQETVKSENELLLDAEPVWDEKPSS